MFSQGSATLALYYLGKVINFFNTVYLLPFVLSPADLGLYAGVQALAFVLSRFNLGQGIIRYFGYIQGGKRKKSAFLSWVIMVATMLYALLLILCFIFKKPLVGFFSKQSAELITYLPLSFLLGYLVLLNVMIKAWYIALKKIVWPNILQNVVLQCLIGLTVLLHHLGAYSFKQLLVVMLVPYSINLALLVAYLWYKGELYVCFEDEFFQPRFAYDFGVYSLFMVAGSALILVITRIDTLMILALCGKHKAGFYRTVAFVALLLEVPAKVTKQGASSLVSSMLIANDRKALAGLYKQTTLIQFLFSCFLFSLLHASLPYLLYALPKGSIALGKQVFLLLAAGELMYNLFNMSYVILALCKHFKLTVINLLLLLVGVAANYKMIDLWGVAGAACGTSALLLANGVLNCWLVWYSMGVQPFSKQLVMVMLATIIIFLLQSYLSSTQTWWLGLVCSAGLIGSVYGCLALWARASRTFSL